jgi:hypothetical protein
MKNARNAALCCAANRISRRLAATLLTTALLVMSGVIQLAGATPARAVTGTCASKDERSDRLIANFKAFVGENGLGGTILKKTDGVAGVTPSQVTLVTDNAICTKAAIAFDKKQLKKRSNYTLYVVSLGSSYAVEDTVMLQAGFETADIYDSKWTLLDVRQIHS